MRIESIQISNKFYEWECDKIDFHSNLTLLVGTSGVGKTQILKGIETLKAVANGESENGFEWSVHFRSNSGSAVHWKGEFELLEDWNAALGMFQEASKQEPRPKIKRESLESNGVAIITRDAGELIFKGEKLPRLSSTQSVVYILKEDDFVKELFESFARVYFKDHSLDPRDWGFANSPIRELKDQFKTLEEIRNSDLATKIKAFLCSELNLPIFQEIKKRFITIFPQIEDLRFEQHDFLKEYSIPKDRTIPTISIKESGVSKWIHENRISSGMRRTINHICELYLANEGSVILLDEFENSLGTNCIDILTDDLIHENTGIQYIATSHHPYIINNIPYEYWKIVTRVGGHIVVKDATDYNLGDSKQDAFNRLTRVLEAQYQS